MTNLNIMGLAAEKMNWLSSRQKVIAQNIANVNTPNYRALDILSFEKTLETASSHGSPAGDMPFGSDAKTYEEIKQNNTEKTHSGNNVSIENEMMQLGKTHSEYSFNASLLKTFHRMVSMSLKG